VHTILGTRDGLATRYAGQSGRCAGLTSCLAGGRRTCSANANAQQQVIAQRISDQFLERCSAHTVELCGNPAARVNWWRFPSEQPSSLLLPELVITASGQRFSAALRSRVKSSSVILTFTCVVRFIPPESRISDYFTTLLIVLLPKSEGVEHFRQPLERQAELCGKVQPSLSTMADFSNAV